MRFVKLGHNMVNPDHVTRIRADLNYQGVSIYMVDGVNIWLMCPKDVESPKAWFNRIIDDLMGAQ